MSQLSRLRVVPLWLIVILSVSGIGTGMHAWMHAHTHAYVYFWGFGG